MLGLDRQRTTSTLLLGDLFQHGVHHLVRDVIHVRAASRGVDGVDKAHLLEAGAVRQTDRDLPALVYDLACPESIWLQMKAHVVLEGLDVKLLAVEVHRAASVGGGGHIIGPPAEQSTDVLLELVHPEAFEVWVESHLREVLRLVVADDRLVAHPHVLLPDLLVLFPCAGVGSFKDKLGREDVGELGAVTIPATHNLFLAVVVVVAGEQMTKDKLWDVALVLAVHLNGNALPIVSHADVALLAVHLDVNPVLGWTPDEVVRGIDQDLVKDLVESRHIIQLLSNHLSTLVVEHP
mmetsp:Transcript_1106/g.1789  ORF Transcript_1106/g.1789 Transcript_1106/m.1789 type:complete len:293 (+) Transcript_1106:4761-5639(+)